MNLQPFPHSSNIDAAGWDGTTHTLRVRFHSGSEYEYAEVPAEVYQEFRAAHSPGSFFASRIKGVYVSTKVAG